MALHDTKRATIKVFPATVTIAKFFYKDHVARDNRPGKLLAETFNTVTVELDYEDYNDLWTDAEVYEDMKGTPDYEENRSYCDSAIRVLNALEKKALK